MSSVTTTTINTINGTTDLTLQTGNTSAAKIVVRAGGGISFAANSSGNSVIIAANGNIGIGNSTPTNKMVVSGGITSTSLTCNSAIVSSNTFTLGTSGVSANGYTWLPNGFLMQWGTFVCNTTSQPTFPVAFKNSVLSLQVTPRSTIYRGANVIAVGTLNLGNASITSVSTTTTETAFFLAIGY